VTDRKVLGEVSVEGHEPTGKTNHRWGDQILPTPTRLELTQYEGNPASTYSTYDGDHELTDTYHDTLVQAIEQARWEFEIAPSEWVMKKNG
jgi:hypothetical protein